MRDIDDSLDVAQPTVSRHLVYLRRIGLVTATRDWKFARHRLAAPRDVVRQTLLGCVAAYFPGMPTRDAERAAGDHRDRRERQCHRSDGLQALRLQVRVVSAVGAGAHQLWVHARPGDIRRTALARRAPCSRDRRPLGGHLAGPRLVLVHGTPTLNTLHWAEHRSDEFCLKMAAVAGLKSGDVIAFGHTHKP